MFIAAQHFILCPKQAPLVPKLSSDWLLNRLFKSGWGYMPNMTILGISTLFHIMQSQEKN